MLLSHCESNALFTRRLIPARIFAGGDPSVTVNVICGRVALGVFLRYGKFLEIHSGKARN